MSHHILDLKGLKCPLPVLRTRREMRRLPAGAGLTVLCTDPLAGVDVPNLVREEGDRLEASRHEEGVWTFRIRKRG